MDGYEFLKYLVLSLTTLLGVFGTMLQTRNEETGKLNRWGYLTIALLVIALGCSMAVEYLDSESTKKNVQTICDGKVAAENAAKIAAANELEERQNALDEKERGNRLLSTISSLLETVSELRSELHALTISIRPNQPSVVTIPNPTATSEPDAHLAEDIMQPPAAIAQVVPPFAGVLAEIFVSSSHPNFVVKGQKYVDALQKAGIAMPIAKPQGRINVADGSTEVRYFYDNPENKEIASDVMDILVKAGIPKDKIRTFFVNDPTTPNRFIQVSMANSAFN